MAAALPGGASARRPSAPETRVTPDMTPDNPVLVVEDDPDCRDMLATLLNALGYSVATAANGAEALALTRELHPCLILLDLMMPVMDGEEFRARQLADPAISDIPVVIVSAIPWASSIAERLRAFGAVAKPIDVNDVSAKVRAACAPQA